MRGGFLFHGVDGFSYAILPASVSRFSPFVLFEPYWAVPLILLLLYFPPSYRGITGAAWVAEAYDIAAENATSLMHIEGAFWQNTVDECKRLAQEYREKAAAHN